MEIRQENNEKNGAFVAMEGQLQAGFIAYTWLRDHKGFSIDHTEVNPDFKGGGVGKALVHEAVAYARKNDLKILVLCPFAKTVFQRNPDLHDVLLRPV